MAPGAANVTLGLLGTATDMIRLSRGVLGGPVVLVLVVGALGLAQVSSRRR